MRLFEPKREKVIKAGENCIILICGFVICSVTHFYYGKKVKQSRYRPGVAQTVPGG
jgi:hypothetical protein